MGTTRTGGRLLVACLQALGATKIFGVPGESYLPVLDALRDVEGKLDFILCRNEGGAAFMAEAWGKLTGQPGVCFVTRGPGATNASIGVHAAMQASTPMILFVGQVGTGSRGREAFQEVDHSAYFAPLAKWAVEVDQPDRLPEIVARSWAGALSGRPGPVVVALPEDVLTHVTEAAPCGATVVAEPAPPPEALDELAERLSVARRPVVIVGGGGWSAQGRADLLRFLERHRLPAISAFRFIDLIDNHSPSYTGEAGVGMAPHVRQRIAQADLIIGLNVRFGEMTTDDWTIHAPPKMSAVLIHSHASDRELNKIYAADLPLHAGPNRMAAVLADLPIAASPDRFDDWYMAARAAYDTAFEIPPQPGPLDMGQVMAHLAETLPEDAVLTNGAGNFAIWPNKLFRFGPDQRLLAPQSGAMGYGLPAAIAAKVSDPGRCVICFAGDGDFQMNCNELGTAMQAGAQPIVLILNNGSYGTIRMHQERSYPARVFGTTLQNPDFAALAQAYGYHGERVERTGDFAAAFARAMNSPTGAVLDLMTGIEALTPKQTLSQIRAGT